MTGWLVTVRNCYSTNSAQYLLNSHFTQWLTDELLYDQPISYSMTSGLGTFHNDYTTDSG